MRAAADSMPALPLAAGALAAAMAPGARTVFEYFMLAAVAAAAMFFVCRRPRTLLPFAFGFAVTLFSYYLTAPPQVPESHLFEEADYVFYIADARDAGDTQLCDATALSHNGRECAPYRFRLLVIDMSSFVRRGDIVSVRAVPEPADRFGSVPFMEMHAMQMRADGIAAFAAVNSEEITVTGHHDNISNRLADVREDLAYSLLETGLPADVAETLVTATLGARWVNEDIKESFRATGLSHLLCISGFHVMIIAWIIGFLLFPLRIWSRAGRMRYPMTIILLWAYAAIVGFAPPVTRATIMFTAFLLARWLQRDTSPFNSLAVAVALLLFIRPGWIYAAGFQLSVCAVAGLLLFRDSINRVSYRNSFIHRNIGRFVIPVAAMLGTAPVLLSWFHRLPLVAIPLNAAASLLFPAFFTAGIGAWLLGMAGLYHPLMGILLQGLLNCIRRLCDMAAEVEGGTLAQIYLSDISLAALIMAIAALAMLLNSRRRGVRWCAAAGVAAMMAVVFSAGKEPPGDSLLVCGNNRHTQVCAIVGGKGYVQTTASKPKPIIKADNYFDGHGIDPDSVPVNTAAPPRGTYVFAGRGTEASAQPRAPYLIIDSRYKGDIKEIINAVRPRAIVLGTDVSDERSREIELAAAGRGIAVHSTRLRAFHTAL